MATVIDASDAPGVSNESYVEWSAILAGAVLAAAISFVLLTFGGAIGLSMASPYRGEAASLSAFAIATALWVLWVEVFSFAAGGYIAGRMRKRLNDATEHEVDVRDGAHGVLVWAAGVIVGAVLAFGAGGAAINAAGNAAQTAAKAADAADLSSDVNRAGRSAIMLDLFRPAPGVQRPANDAARAAALGVLARSAETGLSENDRAYITSVVADQTGVTPEQAQARTVAAHAQASQVVMEAKRAADAARKAGVFAAFFLAASLAVSAAAAYAAATYGGRHRDRGLVLPLLGAPRY